MFFKKYFSKNSEKPALPPEALPTNVKLLDVSIQAKPKEVKDSPTKMYFLRLTIRDKILFAKRLGILLKAGVPILKAVYLLQEQSHSRTLKYITADLVKDVENGKYLHVSLQKYQKIFGDFFINLIRIGEVSGTLFENLQYLALELQKRQALRRKVISALIYPVVIVMASLGVTLLLTVYVFPKILPIIRSFSSELPFSTQVLVWLSGFFKNYWHLSLLVLAGLIVGLFLALKNYRFKLFFDRSTIRIPVLGRIFQGYNISNFTRSLSVLLSSDVRIVEAINITAKTTTNLAYREKILELAKVVTKGEKASTFFAQDTKLFPPMLNQLVAVGESTGHLNESLMYIAEIYESDVDDLTKNLSTVLEPILMIFMGLLVGFVAISIITPIYQLAQNLNP